MSAPEQAGQDAAQLVPDPRWRVVVPLPWRTVRAGDVVESDDDTRTLWMIIRAGWARPLDPPPGADPAYREWSVIAQCGIERVPFVVDPDMMAGVLIEVGHAGALALCTGELPARVLATRTDPDGGHEGDLDWRGESTPIPR